MTAACGSSDVAVPPTAVIAADDPAAAQIVTSDLGHLWAAYDAGSKNGSASAFQTQYLDVASPGLSDFIRVRALTGSNLAQMVTAFLKYFAAIRATNLQLATNGNVTSRIRANYTTIKSLNPLAV